MSNEAYLRATLNVALDALHEAAVMFYALHADGVDIIDDHEGTRADTEGVADRMILAINAINAALMLP